MLDVYNKEFYIDTVKKNGFTGEITAVEIVKPNLEGEHFSSTCISVTVHCKQGEPVELFVKTFTNNEKHTEMLRDLEIFDREAAFFNTVMPELQKIVDQRLDSSVPYDLNVAPKCFYADGEMIVMENLAKKKYTLMDKFLGQNLEQAKLVLRNLAKLHATSYILLSKFKCREDIYLAYPFLRDVLTLERATREIENMMIPIYKVAIEVLQKREQTEEVTFATNWLNDVVQAGYASRWAEFFMGESGHVCFVVNHGDCWNSNMLFQRDPATADITNQVFLDYQIIRVGSPCLDIGYYMFTTVQRDIRKREWQSLLRHYYHHFTEDVLALRGNIKFSFEELVEDYRKKFVAGFMYALCMGGFVPAFNINGDLDKIEGTPGEAISIAIGRWIDENAVQAQEAADGLRE